MKNSMKTALMIILMPAVLLAKKESFEFGQGQTMFEAVGRPNLLKIRGEGSGPTGRLNLSTDGLRGSLDVDVKSLTTGLDLRDRHMHEKYLESVKYGLATLDVDQIPAPLETSTQTEGRFRGQLNLKGVVKDVEGEYVLTKQEDGFRLEAKFPIRLQDFPIGVPSFAGVSLADEVHVRITSVILMKRNE